MKSALFTSPNLKLILAGASLVAVLQQALDLGEGTGEPVVCQQGTALPSQELAQLVDRTFQHPTTQNYQLISDALLGKGDVRGAMFYSRKASLAAEVDE